MRSLSTALAVAIPAACLVLIPSTALIGQKAEKPSPLSPEAGKEHLDPASQINPRFLPASISPRPENLKPGPLSADNITGRWETGIYSRAQVVTDRDRVVYSVFGVPGAGTDQKRLPLVVYFHGEAHNAREGLHLQSGVRHFTTPAAQEEHPCILIAPFTPKGDMTESRTLVSMIEDAVRTYPVDPKRIYLVAVDLGGWGAGGLLVRKPGLIAAMVDIAGLTAFTPRALDGDLAVWGILGKATSNKTRARNNAVMGYLDELEKLGAETNQTNLGVEHAMLEETFFANARNRAWLFGHSKQR